MTPQAENAQSSIPGRPASVPPPLEEPTTPADLPEPKPDQSGPRPTTPTGAVPDSTPASVAQQGRYLTTAHGHRLRDSDHSLRVGRRGPTLLQDHHLREKISHFDHERIPERVVHARGAAAHGVFVANGAGSSVCRAAFLAKGVETPVFVRFSTVLGSRGSIDSARDTRGFATRFYTTEGNYDLVGNNIPVFFIQDGIKFPDLVHAAKPQPDREIPQAQSAHDTFWDFASLHTEAQHHTLWNMSDRGLPRSYRTMEGFGVHTWRLIDADGSTVLVKFHWKPRQGVHSLIWEEAQLAGGLDPDFHRRDLADSIEAGSFPQWDFGVQVMPDDPDQTFEGIDLLDATKFVPEELCPVQVLGTLTLNANPSNYFAETEQVAFNPSNLAPGVDVTDDPLLHARLFSYLDTQITRLGGPNWNQLPINRSHAPVNDNLRDGFHQDAVHRGVAPYRPNSLDAGCPFLAGDAEGAFLDVPAPVAAAAKQRGNPASFDDHFSQPALFYRSLSPVEQDHVVAAYTFELAKCWEETIKLRQLRALANIDAQLCEQVATALGLPAPEASQPPIGQGTSAALSQLGQVWPVAGRQVGVLIASEADVSAAASVITRLHAAEIVPLIIAPRGGQLGKLTVQRIFATAASIELDAVIVAGDIPPAPDARTSLDAKAGTPGAAGVDPRVAKLLGEAWRHAKAIGVLASAEATLTGAGLPVDAPGIVRGTAGEVVDGLLALLGGHRVWARFEPVAAGTAG